MVETTPITGILLGTGPSIAIMCGMKALHIHLRWVVYVHGVIPLLTSASLKNWERQYTYRGNPYVGYAPPGNAQHYPATPGPPPVEYYIPQAYVRTHTFCSHSVCISSDRVCAQGIPNGGIRDHAPPTAMPDVADPFSRNVPNSDPFRMSAMEDLKRLANRYLQNPDSRVNTLRMGLSPSRSRFMVMILLEVDDII